MKICCIGTGPSFDLEQIDRARKEGWLLFGCNLVYEVVPDLTLLYGCNERFWDQHYEDCKDHPCEKWTTNLNAAVKHKLNYIREKGGWQKYYGLCEEFGAINPGHGSGFSLVSMAHKYGGREICLIGYDLKYAANYDGRARQVGDTPRHSLDIPSFAKTNGEYAAELQHWPSQQVHKGVHTELVQLYKDVHEQGLIKIYNCSPDSALMGEIPFMEL